MSNMSYCRFQNTANDLSDCLDHIDDDKLSEDEKRARQWLIRLCYQIVEFADAEDEANDDEDER